MKVRPTKNEETQQYFDNGLLEEGKVYHLKHKFRKSGGGCAWPVLIVDGTEIIFFGEYEVVE